MNALVELLPVSAQPKAKAIVTAIGIVLAVVVASVPVLPKWAMIPVALLTTLLAYQTPAPGYVAPADEWPAA